MVRLKSDRWYSSDGQQRSKSRAASQVAGSRRLISMCLLLALVVVLMQKAADPRHVSNAFKALGVPLDNNPSTATQKLVESARDEATAAATTWDLTCADLLPRLLDDVAAATLDEIAVRWFSRESSKSASDTSSEIAQQLLDIAESEVESLIEQTKLANISPEERIAWLEQLAEFSRQWQQMWSLSQEVDDLRQVSPELSSAMTNYLDQRLVGSLRDASTWTKSETVPFWRLIQRGQGRGAADVPAPPVVSTLQLESQANLLRGKFVRFRGAVRRVERVAKEFPPLGLDKGYWLMWLRGEDDAVQPVAVYTTESRVAELAAKLAEDPTVFPAIEIVAIYAKRLAYGSTAGVQVAPVLFSTSIAHLKSPEPPLVAQDAFELRWQLGMSLLAGAALASCVLIPIWFQFRRSVGPKIKSGGRKAVLGFICLTGGFAGLQPTIVLSQTPPWAQTSEDDAVGELFAANARRILDETSVREVQQHLAGDSPRFPDSILKIVNDARRIGWARALEFGSIKLPSSGLVLRRQQLQGWVRLAMPVQLDDTQLGWFQSDDTQQLYRMEIQLLPDLPHTAVETVESGETSSAAPALVTVYCERLPQIWQSTAKLRQPVQLDVLALATLQPSEAPLCAMCENVQWYLTDAIQADALEPKLPSHYLDLGAAGWDLANFDAVSQQNQKPIQRAESKAFFSLIRIAGEMSSRLPRGRAELDQPLDVLSNAQRSVGKPIRWRVRILSGTLVRVENARDQQTLGSDSYVQYDGFVDIANDKIRFQTSPVGQPKQYVEFEGEFPITILGTTRAAFGKNKNANQGEQSWRIGQYAEMEGLFYRMWSYQSELVSSRQSQARQIAPLVIAHQLIPASAPLRSKDAAIGWFGWALCASTVLILATILYLVFVKDRPIKHF